MGRTARTEPQCLDKGDLYLLPYYRENVPNRIITSIFCYGPTGNFHGLRTSFLDYFHGERGKVNDTFIRTLRQSDGRHRTPAQQVGVARRNISMAQNFNHPIFS